jgi:hypothetical protein
MHQRTDSLLLNSSSRLKTDLCLCACCSSSFFSTQFADSIGLPTDEGLFGFKPFAETWTGRLAMMGFVVSIVEEAMGNGGTLQQIGIDTPSTTVLGLLLGLVGTATVVGTASTAYKLFARKMSPSDISR